MSSSDEVRRARLKEAATLRAQFNHEVAMRRIDFKLDTIEPRLKELGQEVVNGELTEFIAAEDADDDSAA